MSITQAEQGADGKIPEISASGQEQLKEGTNIVASDTTTSEKELEERADATMLEQAASSDQPQASSSSAPAIDPTQ